MYVGHAALALYAKAKRPKISIALLVPLAFAPDWIEWIANQFGMTDAKFFSHSLISVAIGATLAALIYWAVCRCGTDAAVVGATYASHWPADFITGDKPTWPHGPVVGLHVYDHLALDVVLESLVVLAAWVAYRRSLPAPVRNHRVGWLVPIGLIAMQVLFAVVQDPRFLFDT